MRVTQQPCFVLHGRPFRETSLLLEAFSRDHGRVGLVARGARSARSKWKHRLQPFRPLLLGWTQTGELGTLTGADEVASLPVLQAERLICGLYANELLIRFLHRSDPHPALFNTYRQLLAELSAAAPVQPLLRLFERDLLQEVGLGMQLEHETGTQAAIEASAMYEYLPESGPVRRDAGVRESGRLVSGAALIALRTGQIGASLQGELKLLMRSLIRYHLGDKPLASYQLFK